MTKIKYEINGKEVEIEVSDEFASTYIEFCEEEKRSDERYKWHKRKNLTDLDGLIDAGVQLEDKSSNFADAYTDRDAVEQAMQLLNVEQQDLIRQIYFEGKTKREVATEKGVSEQAIGQSIKRALVRLKKYFEEI
jgi:RNA polymerase sigma factor (sigma-70 family)